MRRVPLLLILVQLPAQIWAADNVADVVQFESHVRPILKAHCFDCHGGGEELPGGLDLRLARTHPSGRRSGPAIAARQAGRQPALPPRRGRRDAAGREEAPAGEIDVDRPLDRRRGENHARAGTASPPGTHITAEERDLLVVPADPPDRPFPQSRNAARPRPHADRRFLLATLCAQKAT